MSDTEKREAVLERFYAKHYGKLEPLLIVDDWVMDDMADRIVELEAAEAERDRLRSILASVRAVAQDELRWLDAQLVLRALEETP